MRSGRSPNFWQEDRSAGLKFEISVNLINGRYSHFKFARFRKTIKLNAWTKNWLTALIIGFVTFAVFYPSLQHNFVYWDDNHFFLDNQNYRGLHAENFEWIFFRSYQGTGLYIPLTWLTWSADYAIWGMDPFGYHLTNSIIHAFSASLFFLLTYWLLSIAFAGKINAGPLRTGSAFAALFWSIHPLRVESVAWVVERKDLLCARWSTSSQP